MLWILNVSQKSWRLFPTQLLTNVFLNRLVFWADNRKRATAHFNSLQQEAGCSRELNGSDANVIQTISGPCHDESSSLEDTFTWPYKEILSSFTTIIPVSQ
jgi:hypothetical protein